MPPAPNTATSRQRSASSQRESVSSSSARPKNSATSGMSPQSLRCGAAPAGGGAAEGAASATPRSEANQPRSLVADSSHMPMLAHPGMVVDVIGGAAKPVQER